jgi:hypothetical protein
VVDRGSISLTGLRWDFFSIGDNQLEVKIAPSAIKCRNGRLFHPREGFDLLLQLRFKVSNESSVRPKMLHSLNRGRIFLVAEPVGKDHGLSSSLLE